MKFGALVSPLSEICSCLLENCNFLPPTFLTHDAAEYTLATNTCKLIDETGTGRRSLVAL